MNDREVWGWRDRRTGERVSQSACNSREYAERELEYWWERDRRGGRPDLHELMPHVEVFRIWPEEDTDG